MQWLVLTFDQLTPQQLYDFLRLRSDVFVVEQNCAFPELDGLDLHPQTQHLLCYHNDKLAAYARMLPAGLSFDEVSIGRVVIALSERGKKTGHQLLQKALKQIEKTWPNEPVTIGAQYHLRHFYQQHGFEEISEEYLEDGIAHVDMQRAAR